MPHHLGPVTIVGDGLLSTPRLELHLVPAALLITMYRRPDTPGLFDEQSYTNEHRVLLDDPGPLPWRVPQVEEDPACNRWFVRFVVLAATGTVIGSISFHAPPDGDGMVEIGLGVHESFRGHGYATEALLAMWAWACREPGVTTLRYTVSPENAPSVAIIGSFGFERRGQQIDEIDGPEDIYELSAAEFRRRFL